MKKKILVVEDEPSLRKVLETSLIQEGFAVSTATNGEDGLRLANEEKPDLILLDIILPKMDGFAVLNSLSQSDLLKHTKVLILTNLSYSGNIVEMLQKGAQEYLMKADWTIAELMEKVKNTLKEN